MHFAWVLVKITLGCVLFLGACPGCTMHVHLMGKYYATEQATEPTVVFEIDAEVVED